MKKLISLILALVMVMGLAVSASAASITITPPNAGEGTETGITYTAYKVFDASISGSNASYTIDKSSPYYSTVENSGYFTLEQVSGTDTYVVTKKDSYTDEVAKTFAATLAAINNSDGAKTLTKQDDGNYKVDGLDEGYYLVTSSVGSAMVLQTLGNETVKAKNEYPTLQKTQFGGGTADYGAGINYVLRVTIPATAKGEIVVHDKMTGLELVTSYIAVSIEGEKGDLNDNDGEVEGFQKVYETGDNCTVHFILGETMVDKYKGKTIIINYMAKMTSDAIANNEAWLVDSTFTSNHVTTELLTTDIIIDKYETNKKDTKLAGAQFVLTKKNDNGDTLYYKVADKVVSWVASEDEATKATTDAQGSAKFENLADGVYNLIETAAPAGYNKLTSPVTVTVEAKKNTDPATKAETPVLHITADVENSTGSALPSTGGMGTTLFYVLGGLMMVGAAVVLVTKKRVA